MSLPHMVEDVLPLQLYEWCGDVTTLRLPLAFEHDHDCDL